MKVLLVTQYFYPENFKSNDIAFELVKRGYDVTVLTGIPNYPSGSFFKGYGIFKNRKQVINGVQIYRALLLPRGKGKGLRLVLNYFSWAFFASFRAFFLVLLKRYDAILVHEPSPITQGIPAIVVKKMLHIPMYFWVLDLWPESLELAGGVTNKYILNFFTRIVRSVYRNSDKILISSKGFKKSILEKGDYANKLIYFPNWAEDLFSERVSFSLPLLPKGFIVMFAGNIGEAQDFECIMQCALLLKEEKHIKFVFVGDGRKRIWIEGFVERHELKETVSVLGRFPIEAMPAFFEKADVMLLSLKDGLIFNLTVPAKLQAYMAAGKPIVGMISGEGQNLINDSRCGFATDAGNYRELANIILQMNSIDEHTRKIFGKNGEEYYKRYFDMNQCIDHLCNILQGGN